MATLLCKQKYKTFIQNTALYILFVLHQDFPFTLQTIVVTS